MLKYAVFFLPTEEPKEKFSAPEFIKVPEKITAREHDNAKFLVKVIGQPKPDGNNSIFIAHMFL